MKKPSILFVSWTARRRRPYFDPSTRYRCFNIAHGLARRGYRTACTSQLDFEENTEKLSAYDLYLFHRPHMTDQLGEWLLDSSVLDRAVADFDDLIFSIRHAELTPMTRSRGVPPRSVRNYLARNAEALKLFRRCSVSTVPLTEHVGAVAPHIRTTVIPNAMDPGFIGAARLARRSAAWGRRPYRYGYFSGTASHDADLALAADALAGALLETPQARLLLAGPVTVPHKLVPFERQIDLHPLVSFHDLPFLMARVEIVLAPLENTEFTRCKSGLKFFEAASVGCRVAATPVPDIDRFDSPLLRKCRAQDEWRDALITDWSLGEANASSEVDQISSENSVASVLDKWISVYGS